ncbi:S-layer homology domain-containing protein [Paenibacillus sp. LHD-38]|uniref:S-layer homology domain-containing protein n=1 Tax=Paenibacillus sp. LHD-38 TaxID=3072143 RepID=UPI00280D3B0F|nr:S-layer homology domain-containing protein [Paenibacillus sp. LHD-38]MDQ8736923.1 S-layer homology domain-containing protein [Paenibacillus sp. LHD-38]
MWAWYYKAAAAAEQLGVVTGKPDGSFGVNDSITRQDMAVIIARLADVLGSVIYTAETPKFHGVWGFLAIMLYKMQSANRLSKKLHHVLYKLHCFVSIVAAGLVSVALIALTVMQQARLCFTGSR